MPGADVVTAAAVEANGRVARMALSSMCRDGKHKTCAELRMRCVCSCHGDRPSIPAGTAPAKKPAKAAGPRRPATPPRDFAPARAGAKRPPVIELVKAVPPEPPKKVRVSLAEQVRPLLEEILVAGDRDWFRLVLFFKDRQAAMNLKRLQSAHSKSEWEWRAVRVAEVGQSAIYVRWVGQQKVVV